MQYLRQCHMLGRIQSGVFLLFDKCIHPIRGVRIGKYPSFSTQNSWLCGFLVCGLGVKYAVLRLVVHIVLVHYAYWVLCKCETCITWVSSMKYEVHDMGRRWFFAYTSPIGFSFRPRTSVHSISQPPTRIHPSSQHLHWFARYLFGPC